MFGWEGEGGEEHKKLAIHFNLYNNWTSIFSHCTEVLCKVKCRYLALCSRQSTTMCTAARILQKAQTRQHTNMTISTVL
jgi:hypothetical protein